MSDNDIESESSIIKEHSLINSDTWIDDYKKRIRSPADHYEKKPTVPDSLDPEKWKNYREDLSNFLEYMNLEPIYSELVLIDKLLKDFPNDSDQKIIEEYKKTVQDKNRPNTKHSRKKDSQKDKTDSFYQRKGKRSRNVKFAKNLLTATRKLGNNELRKNFFNRAKFTMSILTDKDITPIIDEFKELFKDFQKI
ncbi:18252_t:CDS:1 [Cetraspora pellucida]|uniref:18252_t:CDS:1 n=1 Tax=Cetraspora pellucida TaxID=1433469 RepID=A0ACA9K9M0_9GLOM|nr:18252_t:CDS:1 [Cetraspora pellucida]